MLSRLFILLLYCLFSLIFVSVSLVFLFPRDKLLSYTEQLIERQLPGVDFQIEAIRYVHPLKVRLYGVVIHFKRYRIELPVDTLLLLFEPRYPVERIGVVGVLLGGDLKADVVVAKNGKVNFNNLEFSEMHLADLDKLEQMINRPVEGYLSFDGRAFVDRSLPAAAQVNGALEIANFRTELRRPIFGENDLSFDTMHADISQAGNRLELSAGRAAGPLFSGTFYGEIQRDRPWERSSLDLTGALSPQPGLLEKRPGLADQLGEIYRQYRRQSIPFTVDGTINEPRFRFTELD